MKVGFNLLNKKCRLSSGKIWPTESINGRDTKPTFLPPFASMIDLKSTMLVNGLFIYDKSRLSMNIVVNYLCVLHNELNQNHRLKKVFGFVTKKLRILRWCCEIMCLWTLEQNIYNKNKKNELRDNRLMSSCSKKFESICRWQWKIEIRMIMEQS